MILADTGTPTPLELTLFDGNTSRGVKAFVKKPDGTPVQELSLPHVGSGTYSTFFSYNQEGFLVATFVTYIDNTYQVEDPIYARVSETYRFHHEPKIHYENKMSSAYDFQTKAHQIITWAERDGQVAPGSDCRISVKKADGTVVFSANQMSPNSDGVFLLQNPSFEPEGDKNYYVTITINVDGVDRITHQTFFTVG